MPWVIRSKKHLSLINDIFHYLQIYSLQEKYKHIHTLKLDFALERRTPDPKAISEELEKGWNEFSEHRVVNDSIRMLIQLGGSFALTINVVCQIISLKSSYILTIIQNIFLQRRTLKIELWRRDFACIICRRKGVSFWIEKYVWGQGGKKPHGEFVNLILIWNGSFSRKKRKGAADRDLIRKQEVYVINENDSFTQRCI